MSIQLLLMAVVAVLVVLGAVLVIVVLARGKSTPTHRPPGTPGPPPPGARPGTPPGPPPQPGAAPPGPPPPAGSPPSAPHPRPGPSGDLATRAAALRDTGRESDAVLLVCDETGMKPDAARAFLAALPRSER